jgi:hypothetical protein
MTADGLDDVRPRFLQRLSRATGGNVRMRMLAPMFMMTGEASRALPTICETESTKIVITAHNAHVARMLKRRGTSLTVLHRAAIALKSSAETADTLR